MNATALADRAARLHAAGMAASDNGRPVLAARRLRAGLRLLAKGGDIDPNLAEMRGRLLVSLAWAESERGRVDLGFRLLDEAEPLLSDDERAILVAQRALLLKRSGRNDLALPMYDRAVAGLSEQARPLDLVKALNNRSLVHLEAGHVRLARKDLRRCWQIASRHGLVMQAVMSRTNLGCLDLIAGDLPSALRAFAASRADYEAFAPGRLAVVAVERARALVAAGLFAEADRELADALQQAARQSLGHTYADALQVRAEAALLAGRPEEAAEWARQARALFLGRDNARRAALADLLELRAQYAAGAAVAGRAQRLAARLSRLGLPEDARVAGLVAARAVASTGSAGTAEHIVSQYGPPGRVDRLDTRLLWRLTRAELATAAGRPAEAARHLVAGMTTLHRHRTQLGCLDLQTGAAVHGRDLARAGLQAALASRSIPAVYRWSERARAQAHLLPPVHPPDDPVTAAALEELRQVRYALRQAELAGRPARDMRIRAEALQRTIRERSWSTPGQAGAGGPTLAPLATVKAALATAALVVYLRDGRALRALVVVDGSAHLLPMCDYPAAEEAVLRLRADLDAQAGRAMPRRLAQAVAAATRRDASQLAVAILDPLLHLVRDRDLVVVPTGLLMTTPWSVLPGCTGRAVTVAPSATAWLAATRRTHDHRPGPATVLVAGPGIARGDAEVRSIAATYPQPTVLTGASASPQATLGALDGVGVAHLAAHGRHQTENPLFSTLELAGGPVMGYDLQRLARAPAMVVLSSCELGLTDVRAGDETVGMATALLAAGAGTVVASVSRVADEDAMTVMTGYHRAVSAGTAPARALAGAVPADVATGFVCLGAG